MSDTAVSAAPRAEADGERPRRRKRRRLLFRAGLPLALLIAVATCRSASRSEIPIVPYAERRTLATPDEISLSYLVAGPPDGIPLVCVHGTPGSALDWKQLLAAPPAGFRVLAIDRPGFGGTTQGGARRLLAPYEAQAAAVAALIAAECPQPAFHKPVVVGHSLGGPIVARLAADAPESVGALVILAGSLDPDLEEPRWYNYAAGAPPISWLLSEGLRISNAEVFAAPRETRALAERLSGVRCPVVIVHGERDTLVPVGNVDFMQRALRGAASVEILRLPDAGHFLPWKNADVVRDAIGRAAAAMKRGG